jgi:uncharacterized BrkB/YihY/UPF0761 family membrane protein
VSFDKIWQNNTKESIIRYSHIVVVVVLVLVLVGLAVVPKNSM